MGHSPDKELEAVLEFERHISNLVDFIGHFSRGRLMEGVDDGCIYHYTSLQALLSGIATYDSESHQPIVRLMASDTEYLNDPKEIKYGKDTVSGIYEKLGLPSLKRAFHSKEHFYLTSLSKNKDSIPMWSQYAQGGMGVSIGFKVDSIPDNYQLIPCLYGPEEAKAFVEASIQNFHEKCPDESGEYADVFMRYVGSIAIWATKNKSFSYEREARVVTFRGLAGKTMFRLSNNLIVPFKLMTYPPESLERIVVGPCADPYRTKRSVKYYLEEIGLGHVQVELSKVPFRK